MKYAIPFFLVLVAFAAFGGAQEGFWRVADVEGRDGLVAPDGMTRFFAGYCHVHPRGSFSHARFTATANASGRISGTFAASSAAGAAFSGLTVVGDFPDHIPEAFILVVR